MLGLFCISEMLLDIGKKASEQVTYHEQTITRMAVIRDIVRRYWIVVKGGTIGTIVGLLPGVGTTLAVFMSYAEAKRSSKTPETFEHGNPEGIIAVESANNATVGSALVPLLALGILGAIFTKVAIALAAIIIDVVPDPLIESNLTRSMTISNARGMSPVQ